MGLSLRRRTRWVAGAIALATLAAVVGAWSISSGADDPPFLKTIPLADFRDEGLVIDRATEAQVRAVRLSQSEAEKAASASYTPGTVVRETALAVTGSGKDTCVCWVVVATPPLDSIPVNGTFEMNTEKRKALLESLVNTWQIDFVDASTGEVQGAIIGGAKKQ